MIRMRHRPTQKIPEQNHRATPKNRTEAIAEKIKILMANEHLRQQFSIEGHHTVLKDFDLYKMVEEVKKLL